ncbi:MarR family winged helix-turn-helix transcriptional regulator [Streptomyces sp. NPDC102256]|uniref:MarR family winged helix-turn-helix transcriptional regulator n=2 Tax=unclassified Streptomyces TaxID=2593676 RepID=UPI0038241E9F
MAARPARGARDAGRTGRTPYARRDGTTPGTARPGGRTGMTTADGRSAADGDPVAGPPPVPVDTVAAVVRQWQTVRPELDTGPMEVIGRVNRCAALLQQAEDAPLRRAGLTRPEFDVLGTLRRTGHELTPGDIARETFSSGAAVTKRLKALSERGLVERRGDTRDRRVAHVRLTDAGRDLVDGVLPDQLAYETTVLSGIDAERQRELAGLLGELLGQLEGRLGLPRA